MGQDRRSGHRGTAHRRQPGKPGDLGEHRPRDRAEQRHAGLPGQKCRAHPSQHRAGNRPLQPGLCGHQRHRPEHAHRNRRGQRRYQRRRAEQQVGRGGGRAQGYCQQSPGRDPLHQYPDRRGAEEEPDPQCGEQQPGVPAAPQPAHAERDHHRAQGRIRRQEDHGHQEQRTRCPVTAHRPHALGQFPADVPDGRHPRPVHPGTGWPARLASAGLPGRHGQRQRGEQVTGGVTAHQRPETGQREQHSAQWPAEQAHHPPAGRGEGVGAGQQLAGAYDLRGARLQRRGEDHRSAGLGHQGQVQHPGSLRAGSQQHQRDGARTQQVSPDHQPPPVAAVREHSGHRAQHQQRQVLRRLREPRSGQRPSHHEHMRRDRQHQQPGTR